ncbi:hypothetical protein K490DRAFT_68457 [Saccharata proteae CBS 121410]|uniref:Uncharacterized protein n=1 Tax=Saccharata proteae CBS 121410 TaxID=1314787 RepID=A0A9P4HN37_9PEZI|nr:hypothetical protein K490DRAFT_68457 [Saccharata proteae CBS 121410]
MANTNRPFLSGFLTAFRAQSAWQKAAATPTSTSSVTADGRAREYSQQHHNTSSTANTPTATHTPSQPHTTASAPRTISSKTTATHHSTPSTTSTTAYPAPRAPYPKSPASPTTPSSSSSSTTTPPNFPPPFSPTKQRRGSDSSSEGFRDNMTAEKWYIGGRTAAGDERFYKLGMVKRARSIDRLSLDRLSL